jgi:hypothetical protein
MILCNCGRHTKAAQQKKEREDKQMAKHNIKFSEKMEARIPVIRVTKVQREMIDKARLDKDITDFAREAILEKTKKILGGKE